MDGQVDTFVLCIKTLREGVLLHTPSTFNLTGLTVRLTRPDRQNWLYISPPTIDTMMQDASTVLPLCQSTASQYTKHPMRQGDEDTAELTKLKQKLLTRYLERPLSVTLRLAIEYALPDPVVPTTSTPEAKPAAPPVRAH